MDNIISVLSSQSSINEYAYMYVNVLLHNHYNINNINNIWIVQQIWWLDDENMNAQ